VPTFRGPISLTTRLLAGSNVTLTGGTSDGAGGVYLTSDVTVAASGGGGGSAPSGTGVAEVVSGSFTSPARTAAVVVVAGLTADPSGSRSALSLGGAAILNVGTSAGTVAAGDDARITGAIQSTVLTTRGDLLTRSATVPARLAIGGANTVLMTDGTDPGWYTVSGLLSVLGSTRGQTLRYGAASAWEAVTVGTAGQVWRSNGTDPAWYTLTASDVGADASGAAAAAQAAAIAASAQRASNLSDLASASSARTNLGLGGAAVLSVGTAAGTVAAGDDSRIVGAVQTSRQVASGTGLTGGGDLSADRTLAVSYGTTVGTATQGNDTRVVNAVQTSRTVNGHALSANVTLTYSDVGADAAGAAAAITTTSIGAVPTGRTVNGHALSANVTVTAADVSALALAGGTMAGAIAMGANGITGLANPTGSQDADTKAARDTAIAAVTTTTLGAVPTGRTLTTTAPLRIGGGASADLSTNRTLSVAAASTSAAGVVQLSSATPQPLGSAAAGSAGTASDAGHVHALPSLATLGAGLQRAVLPVSGAVSSPTGAATVCGWVYLDPTAWAITSKTLVATLEVMGNTSAAACTAAAALYTSSTGIVTDATTTITAQTPTRYTHTLTVPGSATLYELRVTPSGGTGGVDYAVCSATLILTWS